MAVEGEDERKAREEEVQNRTQGQAGVVSEVVQKEAEAAVVEVQAECLILVQSGLVAEVVGNHPLLLEEAEEGLQASLYQNLNPNRSLDLRLRPLLGEKVDQGEEALVRLAE